MAVVLEKKEQKEAEVFYRYRIGNFKMWFTQHMYSGDIFGVSVSCDNEEYKDFELYVVVNEEGDRWYPNEFTLRGISSRMTTTEAKVYMRKMTEVCAVLDQIKHFFRTSFHATVGIKN